MTLDGTEGVIRVVGLIVFVVAWIEAGRGAARASARIPGAASSLAGRIGMLPAYLLVAVPYFAVCALLWTPIPVDLSVPWRVTALSAGALIGLGGAALYLAGRWTLGPEYNVTGTCGAQLFDDHQLVVAGPYRRVRHPMFIGVALGALGGLLVYRTWTFVFVIAALPGLWLRARAEDRLLGAHFGDRYEAYRAAVRGWIPRLRVSPEVDALGPPSPRPGPIGQLRERLAPNTTIGGRLLRGLVIAPGSGWVALASPWPSWLRIAAAVTMAASIVSAVSGHCFMRDVAGLFTPGRAR